MVLLDRLVQPVIPVQQDQLEVQDQPVQQDLLVLPVLLVLLD